MFVGFGVTASVGESATPAAESLPFPAEDTSAVALLALGEEGATEVGVKRGGAKQLSRVGSQIVSADRWCETDGRNGAFMTTRRRLFAGAIMAVAAGLAAPGAAFAAKGHRAAPLKVTYYFLPG
jgi:hypothetical protein